MEDVREDLRDASASRARRAGGLTRRALVAGLGWACGASAVQASPPDVRRELAPTGRLRAAINFGNAMLARRGPSEEPTGLSIDLARELANRLDLPLELVPFDTAGRVTAAAGLGLWDLAFLAIDPVRASEISFTAAYVMVEGTYVVAEGANYRAVGDLDQLGAQIAVGRGSPWDLHLTRQLKLASLRRAATPDDAIKLFVEQKLDAVAGVKQPLSVFVKENAGFRLIEGRFMAIEQAVCLPKSRPGAYRYVFDFVEEMKASGFVAEALARYKQSEAVLAPPASIP
ncbi:transporter substrate-binding domain-containing protein [Enterovirga rhinocerotis]|uniref:Amino acid ABC transporter substrate-binding protein (PAAT family) n=1 Tax=Enterovirga rhinocerotis TaxID=1339210 RepID=A0A4V3DXV9_9HYPH|nr:transporter substrate-binding domain-containing protein [Enterovirga rhinocerotis]TDR90009.1 amino acid ABC transporter substrate-binding protein (PAAT family) [Enterovirga rhinocerotis]